MVSLVRWPLVLAVLGGCHDEDRLTYGWDDRRVLCSLSVDDLSSDVDWDHVDETLAYASREGVVALLHAHVPGETIRMQTIDDLLTLADQYGLAFVRHDELSTFGEPRAGLALAFDDQATQAWTDMRDVFAAHGARVTFYVTRFTYYTDENKAQIAQLAADGHDIEAHTVNHLHANDYVAEHGIDAYLADEVVPSFQVLRDAGYMPSSFAFPFGQASESTINAVLDVPGVERLRVSPGSCPY